MLILLLDSCSKPRIGYANAGTFTKGDLHKNVMETLNRDPKIEKEVIVKSTNEKYKVSFYKRWVQTYEGEYTIFFRDKYDVFVFAFKDDKLYFWGNIDDFKRSNDPITNELGVLISNVWLND